PKPCDRSPRPAPEAASTAEASTTATAELVSMAACAAASSSSLCCLAWVFLWFLRLEKVLKALPHCGHTCGRSPVCVRRCSARCILCMKPFPHTSQRNGRSPECVRRCSRRCGKGRSPVLCLIRLARDENVLPQSEHWKGRSPV
uniref:Uncharacterized protein n=1 Tax=Dicentrarchus labrax TaxID=13489 RepID=A0A8C4DDA3_DICLA